MGTPIWASWRRLADYLWSNTKKELQVFVKSDLFVIAFVDLYKAVKRNAGPETELAPKAYEDEWYRGKETCSMTRRFKSASERLIL